MVSKIHGNQVIITSIVKIYIRMLLQMTYTPCNKTPDSHIILRLNATPLIK